MKQYLWILLAASTLWSASIDQNLYEGSDKEAYYQKIEAQIHAVQESGKSDKEIIQEERLLLESVRKAASQLPQIERFDISALSASHGNPELYDSAVTAAASIRIKIEKNTLLLQDLQAKLVFLKQKIDHTTVEEKPFLLTSQLHFAYYKLQQKFIETKIELLRAHAKEIKKAILDGLPLMQCAALQAVEQKSAANAVELAKILDKKVAIGIDLEKALIEESTKVEQLQRSAAEADAQYQKALLNDIALNTQKSLCMLKEKRNTDFFELLDKSGLSIASLSADKKALYTQQLNVLKSLAKEVFGSTTLFFGATRYETKAYISAIKDQLTSTLFVVNEQPISILSLFKALAIIIIGLMAGTFYKKWIARMTRRWQDMSQMSIRLVTNIGYYLVIIITFFIAVSSIGIDMTSISLIAGALSIGIGFGLQTVVSNLIAGVILMFERTIRIGDTIEISETLRGKVTDMRIRSTTIKTWDNVDIVVPNSSFIQNNVINWTLEDISRRLHIPFSVAYGTKVEDVKNAVLSELAVSKLHYIRDEANKEPDIWMIAMNNSSVDFELLVWVEWGKTVGPNTLRSDFMILIYNALYKHGIQIPFPQLDLYVKQMPDNTLNKG